MTGFMARAQAAMGAISSSRMICFGRSSLERAFTHCLRSALRRA